MLRRIYDNYILEYPKLFLLLIIIVIVALGYQARKLEVDASAETLTLEGDKDLELTREITARYKSPDFLVVTYTPSPARDLLDDKTLAHLGRLRDEILKLDRVESINTILDVPLLESPPRPVTELVKSVPTLETADVDKELARKEFLTSPIYENNLVSKDFKTTALLVNLRDDTIWMDFLNRRKALRIKEKDNTITSDEQAELAKLIVDFKQHRDKMRIVEHENIKTIRTIMTKYEDEADLFLGGVSMIADDMVSFVKGDLSTFGLGVLIFLAITLYLIFRQKRWILLPILCCAFSVIAICGFLGLFGWDVTVISSNFISLQIIITMAITIHLIVRYRELLKDKPETSQRELILQTITSMAKPCAFAILTTVAGFSSLILCDIRPVINFGWMMSAGIAISLFLTFLIFPVVLIQMKKKPVKKSTRSGLILTETMANLTENHGSVILIVSLLVLIGSAIGASQLKVENSFIDYFKKSTEIYQGMAIIDKKLGGTTPLYITLSFAEAKEKQDLTGPADEEADDEFDDFEDEFEEAKNQAQYWFTSDKMEEIEKLHDYIDSLPETGKTTSLGTMLKVGRTINNGEPLDDFMLSLLYNELPEKFRKIILSPYVSVEDNEVLFSTRVIDSDPNLRRNEFLLKVRREITEKVGIAPERIQLGGLMVLYNNMLQSLFDSQILTLGAVLIILMTMFLILFRSFKIALIAILPNILSVGVILGFMGWVGIPLDMMTITLAAICVGIAVDDTIHYIHRFIKEFKVDGNYIASMHRCHESIGYAMYYTSITIIIGFSILVLSNFLPGIYFGILTGLAMLIALIAALTLLPQLIIFLKPFGPEKVSADGTAA